MFVCMCASVCGVRCLCVLGMAAAAAAPAPPPAAATAAGVQKDDYVIGSI